MTNASQIFRWQRTETDDTGLQIAAKLEMMATGFTIFGRQPARLIDLFERQQQLARPVKPIRWTDLARPVIVRHGLCEQCQQAVMQGCICRYSMTLRQNGRIRRDTAQPFACRRNVLNLDTGVVTVWAETRDWIKT